MSASLLTACCEHGPTLLAGVTLLLLAGCIVLACHRSPAARRRHGGATAVAILLYLAVGIVPMRRWVDLGPPPSAAVAASAVAPPTAEARATRLRQTLAQLAMPDDEPALLAPTTTGTDGIVDTAPPAPSTSASTSSAPSTSIATSWLEWLAIAYLLAAGSMAVRCVFGFVRLRRLVARGTPLPASALAGLDLPTGLRIHSLPQRVRPFCAGLWRPMVIVPRDLLAPSRRDELHAVLRHEAAHIQAGDTRMQTLLALLTVPLFCHPLFWWLCRQVRFCSEVLADDRAAPPHRRADYARALLHLAERQQPELAVAGTVAVFHRPSDFYRRIQMLLQRQGSLTTSISRGRRTLHALATAGVVACTGGLFGVPVLAQHPPHEHTAPLQEENRALRAQIEVMAQKLQELEARLQVSRLDIAYPPVPAEADDQAGRFRALGLALLQRWVDDNAHDQAAKHQHLQTEAHKQAAAGRDAGAATAMPSPHGTSHGMLHGATPDATASSPPPPSATGAGSTNTIADLTSRYLDLEADIEVAQLEAAESEQLARAGHASSRDAKRAAVNLRALQKKMRIVQSLMRGEAEATASELAWIESQAAEAEGAERQHLDMQAKRARIRLEALQLLH